MGYGQVPLIREYDAAGKFIYSAQFGSFSGAHPAGSYRAYKYSWTGIPSSVPKLVAKSSGHDGVTVYVSWNGATEVEGWKVLGGSSSTRLEPVGYVRKNGFETEYTLGGSGHGHRGAEYSYVQVEAVGSRGEVLGKSDVVKVDS